MVQARLVNARNVLESRSIGPMESVFLALPMLAGDGAKLPASSG
jgi:hypothetical protein